MGGAVVSAQLERALQQEITLRLRAEGWPVLALPIPNGMWIPARSEAERGLVARVVSQMKPAGLLLPGAPDLVLLWAEGAALVELKRPASRDLLRKRAKGRPTEAQLGMAAQAAELGIRHAFVTSWDELRARLVEWGIYCAQADDAGCYADAIGAIRQRVAAGAPVPTAGYFAKP